MSGIICDSAAYFFRGKTKKRIKSPILIIFLMKHLRSWEKVRIFASQLRNQ